VLCLPGQLRVKVDFDQMKELDNATGAWVQLPAPFSALWLYSFWRQVPFSAATTLFSLWPLVPGTGGELISCAMAAHVLRLQGATVNTALQARLEQESACFQQIYRESDAPPVDFTAWGTNGNEASSHGDAITSRSICLSVQELFELERVAQLRLMAPPPPPPQPTPTPTVVPESGTQPSVVPPPSPGGENGDATASQQQQEEAAPSNTGGVAASPAVLSRNRELERLLGVLEVPFLDLAFIPPHLREELITTEPREALRGVIDSLFGFQDSIRWTQLSSVDSDLLLRLLTTSPQLSNLALTPSEVDKIKRLPLFELQSGT